MMLRCEEKDNKNIKLSIIVPVYNVESYIKKGIDSLIGQTYKDLEIILVDDGSTDSSGLICDEYASNDSRIKVIHKPNGGIVSARKAGISVATGEYAVNFDPDDWIEKEAYECVIDIIKEHNADIVVFGMKKEFSDFIEEQPVQMTKGYYLKNQFWKSFCQNVSENYFFTQPMLMSQCDKVVRTELFKKHENNCSEELKKNVDDAVMFPMLLDMGSIYIDSRCWYHYCVRKNSILWQTKQGDFERYQLLAQHILEAYEHFGKNSGCTSEFILYKLVHHMMLDVPEKLFVNNCCDIFPMIPKGSNIIVYGKGVFANRLINKINEMDYYNIVANIDSKDAERLGEIQRDSYDYIMVAIFNSKIVKSVLALLEQLQIEQNKIAIIDKKNITSDILPKEVKEKYNNVVMTVEN